MAEQMWIEQSPGGNWVRTNQIDDLLRCEHRSVICEEEFVERRIQEACDGRYVHVECHAAAVDDVPIVDNLKEALQHVRAGGEVRVLCNYWEIPFGTEAILKNELAGLMVRTEQGGLDEASPGNNRYYAHYDLEAWTVEKRRTDRRAKKADRERRLFGYDLEHIAKELCKSLGGTGPHFFRVESFAGWVALHDSAKGRRATNKLIKDLAVRWRRRPGKYRNFFMQWMGREVVELLEDRLRAVVKFPQSREAENEEQK